MIIEDECDIKAPIKDAKSESTTIVEIKINVNIRIQHFISCNLQIKSKETHLSL